MIIIIKLNHVTKTYVQNKTRITVLKDVSMKLDDGKIYSLVGESGSGKSTLVRLISMLEKPDSGEIILNNKLIKNLNKKEILNIRKKIQLVLQNGRSALDPMKSIRYLIEEPMKNLTDLSDLEIEKELQYVINAVSIPKEYLNKKSYELSGGEQQRVCMARALSVSPEIIIFDESLSGQDVITRKGLMDVMIKVQKKNQCTMLIITHDIEVARYLSHVIYVMRDGKVIEKVNKELDYGGM